jgi:large subunit ribosomal protein L15
MFGYELIKSPGYKKPKNQRGRGDSSGRGNYSGRGMKGQGSRSGSSMKAYFEGGQTPLTQRLPKLRGFKRNFKLVTTYQAVNVASFEKDERFVSGSVITKDNLVILGYAHKNDTIKVLGNGDLTKKFTFEGIAAFSASAQAKIEAAGGSIA